MYYNVSTASSIAYPDVWDSDYEIIYHMDQSTFGAQSTLDSSGNDRHATPLSTGSTAFESNDLVSAQIGNGLNFDGVDNSNGDYLDLPDLASSLFHNTDFTISAWANIDVLKSWARIVDFGNGQDDNNILFATPLGTENLRYEMRQGNNPRGVTASNVSQTGQWAYFTVVHESSGTATIYHNGTSIASDTVHTSLNESRASNYIGRSNWAGDSYFDGKFDEFRLSSTARSADWIATEYANQNSPSTFFTISGVQNRFGSSALDTTPPIITLNGASIITLSIGSTYNEQNATTDDGSPIVIGGDTVDTNTEGNYTITYNSADSSGNNATQVNRTVIISAPDTTPPVITLIGNTTVYVELGSSYSELGANTDDGSTIVIGGDTVNPDTLGNYTITYDSTNSAGDAIQVNRTIVVRDTIRPTVVGTPTYNALTHTLSITFSENVTVTDSSQLVLSGGFSPSTAINYTNNPTLVLTFNSTATESIFNVFIGSVDGPQVAINANSIVDVANNSILTNNSSFSVQNIISSDDQVLSPTTIHVDAPLILTPEHQNVTINYVAATLNTTNITAGLTAKLVSTNDITVMIPTSTIITHDGTWDSQFLAPRTATITVPSTTVGQTTTSHVTITAITLGDVTIDLNLGDTVASIVFENQGGNNYNVYYVNTIGSTPTQISSCGTSNIAEINTLLNHYFHKRMFCR